MTHLKHGFFFLMSPDGTKPEFVQVYHAIKNPSLPLKSIIRAMYLTLPSHWNVAKFVDQTNFVCKKTKPLIPECKIISLKHNDQWGIVRKKGVIKVLTLAVIVWMSFRSERQYYYNVVFDEFTKQKISLIRLLILVQHKNNLITIKTNKQTANK